MPMLIHRTLENAANGKLTVTFQSRDLEQIHREIKETRRRTLTGIAGGTLLISAAILSGSAASISLAGIAGTLGALLLVGAWL